jgi:Transposase
MRYVGIDYHKRYSVLCATDERGQELKRCRINGNSATGFAQFFFELGQETKVVMEACWNWSWLYDLLEKIDQVDEVVLAHPYKTRLIAEAQIKTDRLDAQMLAKLLRGDLIAQSHAPSAATRARKHLLRQRLFWVRLRTMLRNRIHAILDRQHDLERPQLKNFFSRRKPGSNKLHYQPGKTSHCWSKTWRWHNYWKRRSNNSIARLGKARVKKKSCWKASPESDRSLAASLPLRSTASDGLTHRLNWPLTPAWFPPLTPVVGACSTGAYSGNATSGCAGP